MAERNCTCAHCGLEQTGGKRLRYCSDSCKWRAAEGRRPKRIRVGQTRSPRGPYACKRCAKSYMTRRPPGEGEKFCSKACYHMDQKANHRPIAIAALDRQRAVSVERDALKRIRSNWQWRPSALVTQEIAALRRIAQYVEQPRLKRCACMDCSALVISARLIAKLRCTSCRHIADRAMKARMRKTPSGRAERKRAKAIRRSRHSIQADSIDPIAVFDRDGWKCHICHKPTPKKLRGSNEDRAPELDHIVTLADGGSHTWANVACSCRRCNGEKGARSLGQLNLGWAA